jgi:threonine dehydratase
MVSPAAPASGLTMERVRAAQSVLRQVVPETRLLRTTRLSKPDSDRSGAYVYLKLECEGPTGSFKVRGAYHAIDVQQKARGGALTGVVTSSTGNHGLAVAYAAGKLNLPAKIFLPVNPNPAKRARIAELDAEIVEVGNFLEETRRHAAAFARESGWYDVVDGVDSEMLPGTATIACEILDKLTQVDAIFVPVGDSTLIRGVAFAAKQLQPSVRIVGVQAAKASAYARAFETGKSVSLDSADTIADGLSVRDATAENVREIAGLVDEFRLVEEEEMLAAMRDLILLEHVIAEPAGAATIAAFLKRVDEFAGKRVVLVVSGSNVTEELLVRALGSQRT